MKLVIILFLLFSFPAFCKTMGEVRPENGNSYLARQKFMDLETAQKRYGIKPFSKGEFQDAPLPDQAAMAVSFLKQNPFVGKTTQEVNVALGPSTGHFWNDTVAAYIIDEGWKTGKATWQLVFLIDTSGKVIEAKIHKNCCP